MGFLRRCLLAVAMVLLVCTPALAGPSMSPGQIRALFLQRLVNYVHWPVAVLPAQGEPFIIAAADPTLLRPWFQDADPARFKLVAWPAEHCHVIYLNTDNPREAAAVLQSLAHSPVLTVGEDTSFADMGGIISFIPSGNRLRLLANPASAARSGLGLSARLLELAIVYGATPGTGPRADASRPSDSLPQDGVRPAALTEGQQ